MLGSTNRWCQGARSIWVVGLFLTAGQAAAESTGNGAGTGGVEIHGLASQGFILTTGNDYLVQDSKRGSFQLSEVGLNLTRPLLDRLSFGLQIFAQNFGFSGSYVPQVDWFYLDYRWRDWLGVRAGRLKVPFGLYNDINDIDPARVPVLLPQSVYPLQARSFLFAQTGGELYGFARSRWAGAIDYRVYGGTVFIDPKLVISAGSPVDLQLNVPWGGGARVLWETPLPGLRLGLSGLKLRLDALAFLPMGMTAGIKNDSSAWVASLDYVYRSFSFTAEYGRGHSKQESAIPTSNIDMVTESAYVMATFTITAWLQQALYYALKFPDIDQRAGLENRQHDLSATLRFDINQYWLVKLEAHYMIGTTGLLNPLRVTPPPENPAHHWAVFLAKTTAYF